MWQRVHTIVWGAAHVERGRITWRAPLRAAIVTTLICGLAIGLADDPLAIPLTIGALFAGIADMAEAPGQRVRSMLWTSLWVAVGGLAGGLVSDDLIARIVIIGVVGAICGYAGTLGTLGGLVGVLTLVVTTIATGVPESTVSALQWGVLLFVGGLVQTGITVVPDLVRRRRALFDSPVAKAPVAVRLREHLRGDDPLFRHAVRLAVAMPVAAILAAMTGWPHAYWIPLTVAWLSKPNRDGFGSRILARVLGTIGGIGASVLLIDVLHLPALGFALLVGVGSFVAIAFLSANYAVAVVGITSVVMALFTLIGDPVAETAVARIEATLVGSLIVIIAPLLYPPPKPAASHA